MRLRLSAGAGLLAVAALIGSITGCSNNALVGPTATTTNLNAEQINAITSSTDQGIVALKAAGYTPLYVVSIEGEQPTLQWKKCGEQTYENCTDKVNPTNESPVIRLELTGPVQDNTAIYRGVVGFQYPTPKGRNGDYKLLCVPTVPNPESVQILPPSGLNKKLLDQRQLVGNTFEALEYEQPGSSQTKPLDDVTWKCTLS